MRRGEVYWAELAPRSGSEQMGRRPVIILSDDAFNERGQSFDTQRLATYAEQVRPGQHSDGDSTSRDPCGRISFGRFK